VLLLVQQAVQNIRFGYAAAIGVILFALIFGLTVLQRLLFRGGEST
jgi:ABC-type sugar transport system permease subunit